MKAVILAAGPGTRLAPLTNSLPKILAPLGGEPLLAHQLRYLESSGATEVAINTHYRADQVLNFLASFETKVEIRISHEEHLLGTAGALRPLSTFLDEPFVVIYGDVVTDTHLSHLMDTHKRDGGIATIAYYKSPHSRGKGICNFDDAGQLTAFVEKPEVEDGVACISAGLYVLEPRILEFVGDGCVDFGFDVLPRLLAAGEIASGYEISSYLKDVGSLATLDAANRDLAEGTMQW